MAVAFTYWIMFEWVFFFYPQAFGGLPLVLLTNAYKLLGPVLLIGLSGIPRWRRVARSLPAGLYACLFVALLVWSLVPTLIGGDVGAWLRLLPRLVFFIGCYSLFTQFSHSISTASKYLFVIVVVAVVQNLTVFVLGSGVSILNPVETIDLAGPFGLLGNVTSRMQFGDVLVPRLAGFWNEPSNASSACFVAWYLARYVRQEEPPPAWSRYSWVCLLAGLLCLSNAGYIALLTSIMFGAICRRQSQSSTIVPVFLTLALIGIAVLGRPLVAQYQRDNLFLRSITGLRGQQPADNANELYGGRLGIASETIQAVAENPFGLGVQRVGEGGIEGSATAPLLWLLLTGYPGLFILLSREGTILLAVRRLPQSGVLIAQAWVVIFVQHLSYGSWMSPLYLLVTAAVLSLNSRTKKRPT
jgi:hypothetical protein